MSLSKLAKLNGNWSWIVFSDEEEKAIRDKHRNRCNTIFAECLEDAKDLVPDNVSIVIETACTLFSKRADAIFSALQSEIDKAICNMQRGKE